MIRFAWFVGICMWFSFLFLTFLFLNGCTPKTITVYKEVPMPYPQKCKIEIPPKVKIQSTNRIELAESIRNVVEQRDRLYTMLLIIPCLEQKGLEPTTIAE